MGSKLYTRGERIFKWVSLVLLLVICVATLAPFVLILASSLTDETTLITYGYSFWPQKFSMDSYLYMWNQRKQIGRSYLTSLGITAVGTVVSLLFTTMLAYPMSRKDFKYSNQLSFFVFFTMLFNGGIIPLYLQMKEFHLTNTLWSVVLAGTVNVFYFVIMRNYFQSLPESLIESARLDGAGEWRVLGHIILPLSKPIIATLTLFYLVDRWNEWYNALIFIRDTEMQPLQLVLRSIVMESSIVNNVTSAAAMEQMQNFDMGVKMAAVIVTILPVMCVYPFLQKHFAQGVMVGAVKA